jgi:hypothetical protein
MREQFGSRGAYSVGSHARRGGEGDFSSGENCQRSPAGVCHRTCVVHSVVDKMPRTTKNMFIIVSPGLHMEDFLYRVRIM